MHRLAREELERQKLEEERLSLQRMKEESSRKKQHMVKMELYKTKQAARNLKVDFPLNLLDLDVCQTREILEIETMFKIILAVFFSAFSGRIIFYIFNINEDHIIYKSSFYNATMDIEKVHSTHYL